MHPALTDLLELQSGVINRAQVHAAGLTTSNLRSLVHRRELTRVHPGVFVNHSGQLTWLQRAWAAVLVTWPAALHGESALRAYGLDMGDRGGPIHLAVASNRHPKSWPGLVVHRTTDYDRAVLHTASPPRIRLETAAVRVADHARDEHGSVRVLTDVVGSRRTTADRLLAAARDCPRLTRRTFIINVLGDVAHGTHSVLERAYLHRVERAHGLPPSARQVRDTAGGRSVYRDTLVGGLVVELDGRTHHEGATARHRDLSRDLAAAVAGLQTVRLGWGQVFGQPCATARSVGHLLRARGWTGAVGSCPDCP